MEKYILLRTNKPTNSVILLSSITEKLNVAYHIKLDNLILNVYTNMWYYVFTLT